MAKRPRARTEFERRLWRETLCPKCGHNMVDHAGPNHLDTLHNLLEGMALDQAGKPYKMTCFQEDCVLTMAEGMAILLEEARRRKRT